LPKHLLAPELGFNKAIFYITVVLGVDLDII